MGRTNGAATLVGEESAAGGVGRGDERGGEEEREVFHRGG